MAACLTILHCVAQEEIPNELASNKGHVCGLDHQGRPLILVIGKLHSRSKRDFEESKRFMCYCLDASLKTCDPIRNPTGKMVGIMDLRGEFTPSPQSCSYLPHGTSSEQAATQLPWLITDVAA